jgi:penicillin-binding protein-related factor A (putative recombinase)
MAESSLSRYVTKGLRKLGADVTRHEDIVTKGVPDVSYGMQGVNGWIELKEIKWKKRRTTGNDIGLSPEQRLWLRQRGKQGGRCFVLVRATESREYFLFSWRSVPKFGDMKITREEMHQHALRYWNKAINMDELVDELTQKERHDGNTLAG